MSSESKNIMDVYNIRKFIILCFKSWKVFAISIFTCVFLAGVLTILRPQKQEVLAQMILKDESGGSSMMMAGQIARSFSLGDMFGGSSSTDNETYVIKSHTVFYNTARQMQLNKQCYTRRLGFLWDLKTSDIPLSITAPAEMADTLSVPIYFTLKRTDNGNFDIKVKIKRKEVVKLSGQSLPAKVATDYGTFVIDKTEYYNPEGGDNFKLMFCSYDAAASVYEKIVNVYVPDRKSDFIDLSFVTSDPAFGKDLLSHIIANYTDISNVYKTDRSMQSLKLVDDRLATLQAELLQSESDLETFKTTNKLTDVEVDAQYLMSKTGELESSLLQAQTNYEVIKLTHDFINNPNNNYSLIPELYVAAAGTSADNVTSPIAQYNQLILQRMELLASAKSNNTIIKQLDSQIDALRQNIVTSVNRAYQNAALVLRDIKNEDIKNKSRLGEIPALERQYLVLKRDNLLQEQIYLFLLQQREELSMNLAARSFPAQIIDYPYVLMDKPGLSKMVTLALGFILGGIIALLYVFFNKMRKAPFTTLGELKSTLETPMMHGIQLDKDDKTFAISDGSVNAEPFRQLRSDLQFALSSCEGKAFVVTSVNEGEGKTYVSANLAASLAVTGKRVVLVDVDLQHSAVAARLGVTERRPIFSQYVYNGDDMPRTTVAIDDHNHLDVIATCATSATPSDLIASDRFAAFMAQLRVDYDYVVVDTACIKDHSDIYYLTDLTDLTLVVCRAGVVTNDDANMLNRLYTDGRLKRIAVTPNCF